MPRHTRPANANGHRRRQLAARIKATATHCALCNQPLNPHARWPAPDSTVIDEDIPRARGGDPLARSNTNAMHNACNRFKSTMTLTEARTLLQRGANPHKPLTRAHRRQILTDQQPPEWETGATNW